MRSFIDVAATRRWCAPSKSSTSLAACWIIGSRSRLRLISLDGFSHGQGGVVWWLFGSPSPQSCAWTASFLSGQSGMQANVDVGAYSSALLNKGGCPRVSLV
jgi:hypothetical protein